MQTITFIVIIVLVIMVANSVIKGTNLDGIPPTEYTPDVAIPPGATILEILESLDMTQAELAEWMGCPSNVVNEIIEGERAITYQTAIALERVLIHPVDFWMNLEKNYRTQQDYTKCPQCGGPTEFSRSVPPEPYWCEKCEEIERNRPNVVLTDDLSG